MFWTKRSWPYITWDIILLARIHVGQNILDKPTMDKMILDEVLFSRIIVGIFFIANCLGYLA